MCHLHGKPFKKLELLSALVFKLVWVSWSESGHEPNNVQNKVD